MDPAHETRVLDMNVIAELKQLGGEEEPGLFAELIGLFLEDAQAHLETLGDALERADAGVLERAAHTLKSSCGNVGAVGLARTCFQLEQLGRSARLDGAEELLAAALREFEEVSLALETERS
jgi:HPt (histidine-containing phosphotransfer) domain-containing protein